MQNYPCTYFDTEPSDVATVRSKLPLLVDRHSNIWRRNLHSTHDSQVQCGSCQSEDTPMVTR